MPRGLASFSDGTSVHNLRETIEAWIEEEEVELVSVSMVAAKYDGFPHGGMYYEALVVYKYEEDEGEDEED